MEVFMLVDFYVAGGWGMFPVSAFGFLLIAATVLHLLRPKATYGRLIASLGVLTFAMGLLGAATGITATAHYLQRVEPAQQIAIFALGIDESLHNVVLALLFVILAALVSAFQAFRTSALASTAAAG